MFCVECGFQNGDAANFCAKCGALLAKEDPSGQTTMSFAVQDGLAGDDDVAAERPVLVIRAGGGRAGEHLSLRNDRESIGRAPDADLFLDDVTVSRQHAVIERDDDAPAERPVLVIRAGGGRAGEHLSLRNPRESIGRAPDADLFLDDVTVSRRHAVIERDEDGLYIEDLESLNGTFVNRTRIGARQRLHDGDEVQIGKFKLTFLEG